MNKVIQWIKVKAIAFIGIFKPNPNAVALVNYKRILAAVLILNGLSMVRLIVGDWFAFIVSALCAGIGLALAVHCVVTKT